MQLAILTLVRNEASRWLPSLLQGWTQFADRIIALDDSSTDSTPELLHSCPKVELHRRAAATPMWGQEAHARQQLWRLGAASGAEWLLCLDADMIPACNPRPLLHPAVDAIAFRLYDLWHLNPPLYRTDAYWRGHEYPRVWAVRNPGRAFIETWPDRGMHCGHFPNNLLIKRCITAPPEHSLLHLAYSDKDSRVAKREQYMDQAMQLSLPELQHAASITDSPVQLSKFPHPIEYSISKVNHVQE